MYNHKCVPLPYRNFPKGVNKLKMINDKKETSY